jgi:outer membrane protein
MSALGMNHGAQRQLIAKGVQHDQKTKLKEFPINMKRSVSAICLLACGLALPALAQTSMPSAPAPAGAEAPAGPTKVAVIMFEAAVGQTNEGQRDFAQLQTKYQPKEAALKAQNDEIETLKKQLQTAGATLSDAERASRAKTIDEKEKVLQRSAQEAQSDFQSEMGDTMQTLAQKVMGVVQKYAAQNGYTIVLDASQSQQQQSNILWASESTNITKAIIDAYNAQSGVPAQAPAAPRTPTTTPHSSGTKTPQKQ